MAAMKVQQLIQQQQQLAAKAAAANADGKTPSKKSKAAKAKEAKLKAQQEMDGASSVDSGIGTQSEASWHERAQVIHTLLCPIWGINGSLSRESGF